MTVLAEFNSVREYLLYYADSLPKKVCYYKMIQTDQRVVNADTFDSVFDNIVIPAENYIFTLIEAIDMLIEQQVLGVSYKDFAIYAHHLILNPSGYSNDIPVDLRIPFNLEQEIMADIKYNIENYWMYPKCV